MNRKIVLLVLVPVLLFSIVLGARPIERKTAIANTNDTLSEVMSDSGESSGVDWWPMFHHDMTHTGYSTSTAPNTNQTLWSSYINSYESSPSVVGGVVYVGSFMTTVYPLSATTGMTWCFVALNATNGTQIWNCTTGGDVNSSPAVAGGVVYVGSNDGRVYALNATTGAQVWNYTTGNEVWSSPAVVGGVVYVGSNDHNVYALSATTGTQVWNYTTDNCVQSSPAVVGGVVYVGSDDHNVTALNATTGTKVWNYTTGGAVWSSPAVVDGRVYVGSDDNKTYCLNASTGSHIWDYTTGGAVGSSPAVAGGVVYVGSHDHNVYALNATTGTRVWNYTTGSGVHSSPAVAGGVVYVGSHDHNVYALNATNGTQVWNCTTPDSVYSSPAVVGGVVYVGSFGGRIYAFGKQVYVHKYYSQEPAPMGIADYGMGPNGPYEYATTDSVGIITIASLLTNNSLNETAMCFQLNVNLAFNTGYGQYVYWIQNAAIIDTSSNRVDFLDNVWNFSAHSVNMSASGVSGNGTVDSDYGMYYYWSNASQPLPGSDIILSYPTNITLHVTSAVSSSGKPTVSFAYDDGYGLITYDTVTFTSVTGLTSLTGFEVDGCNLTPRGTFYNSELILGGYDSGSTTDIRSDVQLQLEYWNGHNYQIVPNAYNFGETVERINNVLSGFSHYPWNGKIFAQISNGTGQLGELYNQSQIGIIDITSPLTSGTLYVTNASDPLATAWQIPFVSGEVTVTLYPGCYDLQLYNQYGQLYDQGNFTVSPGQILHLQAPFHNVAVTDVVTCKNVVGQGDSLNVNVTVANTGEYTETFNVTVYSMNSSSIEADKVDEWGYSGNILNPQAAVDEDWTTYAYGAGYIFENFTVPSPSAGGTISANWTYKIEAIECIPSIWYWNYSQNDWSLLCSVIGPGAVIIPNDGLTGEKLEIRTLLLTNFGSGIMYRTDYYEGKVTWTFGNIIADFANVALSSQSSVVIAFSWNTAGFDLGNYTISAYAAPVLGEINVADNTCVGNSIQIIAGITGGGGGGRMPYMD